MDPKDPFEEIDYNFQVADGNLEHFPASLTVSGIHRAVLEGNLPRVKRLIDSGGSVNETENRLGFTPLHLAALKNDLEILGHLLARDDVEVNATSRNGKTPLGFAALLGWTEFVERLCRAGADVNLSDDDGNSPLHVSVRHPHICRFLILRGALIDAVNDGGSAPLHEAVRCSSPETVHALLYYDADTNVADRYGATPFMTALSCGDVEAQRALLEYVDDFNRRIYYDSGYGSILCLALHLNSPLARDIIERGANVNFEDYPEASERNCAFATCLFSPLDISTFRMVWERLRHKDGADSIDLVDFLCYADAVSRYFPVILESDNFRPVVEFLSKGENYYLFVNKFAESKFDLDQLTVLTCRLLQEGFRASSYDIHAVFRHYGYCELFRILLYVENDFTRGWLPSMALCRLICDVDYDLEDTVADLSVIPTEDLLQWLEYHVVPSSIANRYRADDQMSKILDSLPSVPSLLELSRNAARVYVRDVLKVTSSCRFYTAIDNLPLPDVCKGILKFERQLYTIV